MNVCLKVDVLYRVARCGIVSSDREAWRRGSDALECTLDVHRLFDHVGSVILSYRDRRTKQFADGAFVRPFQGFDRQGWKRLEILNAAVSLADLAGLPSNRLDPRGRSGGTVVHSDQPAVAHLL